MGRFWVSDPFTFVGTSPPPHTCPFDCMQDRDTDAVLFLTTSILRHRLACSLPSAPPHPTDVCAIKSLFTCGYSATAVVAASELLIATCTRGDITVDTDTCQTFSTDALVGAVLALAQRSEYAAPVTVACLAALEALCSPKIRDHRYCNTVSVIFAHDGLTVLQALLRGAARDSAAIAVAAVKVHAAISARTTVEPELLALLPDVVALCDRHADDVPVAIAVCRCLMVREVCIRRTTPVPPPDAVAPLLCAVAPLVAFMTRHPAALEPMCFGLTVLALVTEVPRYRSRVLPHAPALITAATGAHGTNAEVIGACLRVLANFAYSDDLDARPHLDFVVSSMRRFPDDGAALYHGTRFLYALAAVGLSDNAAAVFARVDVAVWAMDLGVAADDFQIVGMATGVLAALSCLDGYAAPLFPYVARVAAALKAHPLQPKVVTHALKYLCSQAGVPAHRSVLLPLLPAVLAATARHACEDGVPSLAVPFLAGVKPELALCSGAAVVAHAITLPGNDFATMHVALEYLSVEAATAATVPALLPPLRLIVAVCGFPASVQLGTAQAMLLLLVNMAACADACPALEPHVGFALALVATHNGHVSLCRYTLELMALLADVAINREELAERVQFAVSLLNEAKKTDGDVVLPAMTFLNNAVWRAAGAMAPAALVDIVVKALMAHCRDDAIVQQGMSFLRAASEVTAAGKRLRRHTDVLMGLMSMHPQNKVIAAAGMTIFVNLD